MVWVVLSAFVVILAVIGNLVFWEVLWFGIWFLGDVPVFGVGCGAGLFCLFCLVFWFDFVVSA